MNIYIQTSLDFVISYTGLRTHVATNVKIVAGHYVTVFPLF